MRIGKKINLFKCFIFDYLLLIISPRSKWRSGTEANQEHATSSFEMYINFIWWNPPHMILFYAHNSQTKHNIKAQAQRARIDMAVDPRVKAMKDAFFNRGLEFIILLWKKSTAMRSTRAM